MRNTTRPRPINDDPCANCGRDLRDHDREDLRTCQREHDDHLAGRR
jgi:hypothetical protein